jgi:hypothetical protein
MEALAGVVVPALRAAAAEEEEEVAVPAVVPMVPKGRRGHWCR